MRHLIVLGGMAVGLAAFPVKAASLNKCTDAHGMVTYSNLPCRNARDTRTLEIDPAPRPDPVKTDPTPARAKKPAPPATETSARPRLDTQRSSGRPATSTRQCDALSDKLGRVFDKMDQARRQGYTPKQMGDWNQEVKELEYQKQQSGCF